MTLRPTATQQILRVTDFTRAMLRWQTPAGSNGLWRIAALAIRDPGAGETVFALSHAVMAGDVYGDGILPLTPGYAFQLIASKDRHIIIREGHPVHKDTADSNPRIFASLTLDVPNIPARAVNAAAYGAAGQMWPLVGRIEFATEDGVDWRLEFPINHLNHRTGEQPSYQVETGPILVPSQAGTLADAVKSGDFALAYVYFNRENRVDIMLMQSARRSPPGHEIGIPARIDPAKAQLFVAL